jgi:hypothetical protein
MNRKRSWQPFDRPVDRLRAASNVEPLRASSGVEKQAAGSTQYRNNAITQ